MKKIERRDFLKKTSIAVAGAGLLTACNSKNENTAPAITNKKKYNWKMVTAWPPHFPILGEGADKLAKDIEKISGGQLKIRVYGGGELVPPLESFDAVSQGIAEMCHSASYYWAGKVPASQFFTSLPFGMNTIQTYAWLQEGGGHDLWKEVYEKFNLIPFPAGCTSGQMGGWFNKKINSKNDLNGLKIRIPGIGGKVYTKAGSSAILSAGGEIYTNLERGVIDAAEWVGPYHDYLMGFHKIAQYYYYPSWHETTGVVELVVNKNAFESLPADLQKLVEETASAYNIKMISEFEAKNAEYLEKIKNETNVKIEKFPDEVLESFKEYSKEVIDEIVSNDAMSKKVYDSYKKFQNRGNTWVSMSQLNYSVS
ncbi:MAG: TRAP transporter substrate-binding protein DctP [Ignavibacteria bacterium]|jgi:TRAP-type mannitol/chloroaromatic compound transport system substrate-binding protein